MFDQDAAIANWKRELAENNAIDSDAVDEMASHLADETDALSRLGLSPQESFIIATRRIGPTQDLAQEFAKVAPHGTLIETLRWLATGAIAMVVVSRISKMVVFLSALIGSTVSDDQKVSAVVPVVATVAYLGLLMGLVAYGLKHPEWTVRRFVSRPAVLVSFLVVIEGIGLVLAFTSVRIRFDTDSIAPMLLNALTNEFMPLIALGVGALALWTQKKHLRLAR